MNHKDIFDCTPLHFAVINGQFKCTECLLALGANPNAVNADGQTPLHVAVQKYVQMNSERVVRRGTFEQGDNMMTQQDEDDEYLYEDLKRIMKELLFNGAHRHMLGKFTLSDVDAQGIPNRQSTVVKELTPF